MPRVTWLLDGNRPVVQVQLIEPTTGNRVTRTLLADTGAGRRTSAFELILSESGCEQYLGMRNSGEVGLGGAITGTHPIYSLWVEIPALSFARRVNVVAVPAAACPAGLDGFACFRFLNAFTYGNLGDGDRFGLETA